MALPVIGDQRTANRSPLIDLLAEGVAFLDAVFVQFKGYCDRPPQDLRFAIFVAVLIGGRVAFRFPLRGSVIDVKDAEVIVQRVHLDTADGNAIPCPHLLNLLPLTSLILFRFTSSVTAFPLR